MRSSAVVIAGALILAFGDSRNDRLAGLLLGIGLLAMFYGYTVDQAHKSRIRKRIP